MRLEQVLEDALAARVTRGVDGLDLDLGAHAEERVDTGQQLAHLGGGRERPLTAHPTTSASRYEPWRTSAFLWAASSS